MVKTSNHVLPKRSENWVIMHLIVTFQRTNAMNKNIMCKKWDKIATKSYAKGAPLQSGIAKN